MHYFRDESGGNKKRGMSWSSMLAAGLYPVTPSLGRPGRRDPVVPPRKGVRWTQVHTAGEMMQSVYYEMLSEGWT